MGSVRLDAKSQIHAQIEQKGSSLNKGFTIVLVIAEFLGTIIHIDLGMRLRRGLPKHLADLFRMYPETGRKAQRF